MLNNAITHSDFLIICRVYVPFCFLASAGNVGSVCLCGEKAAGMNNCDSDTTEHVRIYQRLFAFITH